MVSLRLEGFIYHRFIRSRLVFLVFFLLVVLLFFVDRPLYDYITLVIMIWYVVDQFRRVMRWGMV